MSTGGLQVQVFGTRACADTRKALRFFAERRVRTHFVDLKKRAASPGELRRFVHRFGWEALVDRNAKRFRSLGLHTALYGPERWVEILAEEPAVLRTPLARCGPKLSIGYAPDAWSEWVGR